jgi:WD40 repeat protein
MTRIRAQLAATLLMVTIPAIPVLGQAALEGHTDDVYFVAFLPDGKTVLSGAEDASIRLWNAVEGTPAGVWQQVPKFGPAPSTKILALSGDGRLLARAGKEQGTVEVWDVAKVASVRVISAHQRPVYGVALSGDGSVLVSFSQDEVKVWNAATGKGLIGASAPINYAFRAAAVTRDGRTAAVSASDKTIALFDVASARQVARIEAGPGQLHALAFSPDGRLLASGSDGGPESSVKVWEVESQKPIEGVTGSPDYAKAVAFSPDGRSIAAAGMMIRVWNLDERQVTAEF